MRVLALRELERQIRAQRQRVADDRRRLEHAVSELPVRALRAVASPAGLLISFSLGAAAAGATRSHGVLSLVARDVLTRVALDGLPAVGDLMKGLRSGRRGSGDPA